VLPLLFELVARIVGQAFRKKMRNTCAVLPLKIILSGVGGKRRRLSGCYLGGVQSRPQTGIIILIIIILLLHLITSQTGLGIFLIYKIIMKTGIVSPYAYNHRTMLRVHLAPLQV
jgi:hypothetical protein